MHRSQSSRTFAAIALSALASIALVATGLGALPAPAQADTPPALPQTVSADALPTPQINGVVWKVALVGNTAYAVGEFTSARPYGAAAGTNEVPRNNAMAFDVTTGAILPWNPNLNAQALSIAVSPDGGELYVGGDFTTVSGQAQSKIAGFKLPSGALDTSFQPKAYGEVNAVAVSGTTVYAGGSFGSAANSPRANLAAFNRADGSLTAWAPTADDIVEALAAYPDGSRIIVGGRFQSLNGQGIVGIGAVDGATGATQAWTSRPVPTAVTSNGTTHRSWVTSIVIDNGVVYAGADGEGPNWFDGRFAATASNGDLIWLDNCYGATYGEQVIGQIVYYVSHSHDCSSVGTFPEQNPRTWRRATADTTYATGTDQGNPSSNSNYSHQPVPTQLNWYPSLSLGSYTGQFQGAWSLGTNGKYLVAGGEFPKVNGKDQQGLVTFAQRDIAPNKIGPDYSTATKPSAKSYSSGSVHVTFTGTSDEDDASLTYNVYRDGQKTPVYTVDAKSPWWALPQFAFSDTGLAPGSSHTYQVIASDAWGNSTPSPKSDPVTVSSAPASAYSQAVLADGAFDYWPLNEASGSVAYDNAGSYDADAGTGVTRGTTGPVVGDTASTFDGTNNGNVATRTAVPGPNTFTLEAWFKTTSIAGGKIVGFGNTNTGDSANYDRHIYIDGTGRVTFGVYPGSAQTVTSAAGLNDGEWHMVTASLGSAGMALYIDGAPVASKAGVTSGQSYSGYWRIGGDNLSGWPNTGSSNDLAGSIGDVAVYPTVLSSSAVSAHYAAGTGQPAANASPTAAFTSSTSGLTANVDGSASSDSDGTIASYAWSFGDGGTGSGVKPSHTYSSAGTFTVSLTVTDDKGGTGTVSHAVTVAAAPPGNAAPTAAFTSSVSGSSVSVDGSGSSDSDGSIAGYAWTFGDGGTGSGATASHTYTAAGTYTVTLTVTDDKGATGTVTHSVTVSTAPASTAYAQDSFGRTVSNGFGTADVGGAWSSPSASSYFSVASGAGRITVPAGSGPSIYLSSVSSTDTEVTVGLGVDKIPTGGNLYASVVGRNVAGQGSYRAKVSVRPLGGVSLGLVRTSASGAETTIASDAMVSGLTYTAGDVLNLRVQVVGTSPTTIRAKVWKKGTTEPTSWQKTQTDSTAALQVPGSIGFLTYLSGSATNAPVQARFTDLWAGASKLD